MTEKERAIKTINEICKDELTEKQVVQILQYASNIAMVNSFNQRKRK